MTADEERTATVCAVCGQSAPQTETPHTLISGRFGWRLLREKSPTGSIRMAWYCAECWLAKKNRTA